MPYTRLERKKMSIRVSQLNNKILEYLMYDNNINISDHLNGHDNTKLTRLYNEADNATWGSRNWRRIQKYINRIRRTAVWNWMPDDIENYASDALPEHLYKEYRDLLNKLYE